MRNGRRYGPTTTDPTNAAKLHTSWASIEASECRPAKLRWSTSRVHAVRVPDDAPHTTQRRSLALRTSRRRGAFPLPSSRLRSWPAARALDPSSRLTLEIGSAPPGVRPSVGARITLNPRCKRRSPRACPLLPRLRGATTTASAGPPPPIGTKTADLDETRIATTGRNTRVMQPSTTGVGQTRLNCSQDPTSSLPFACDCRHRPMAFSHAQRRKMS